MALVQYETSGTIATIRMDDGKANALSPAMLDALGGAFDRAEAEGGAAVVLTGRPGRFSGGFDLGVFAAGGADVERMVRGGFELSARMLDFPRPIVVACTGHALAMGLFLACSGDYRIGAAGDFKLRANEVAIGLTMPLPAVAILRYRLAPSAFDRAVGLSESFDPDQAVSVGLLDRLVAPDAVHAAALAAAEGFSSLDLSAHAASKRRARSPLLAELRAGIAKEFSPAA